MDQMFDEPKNQKNILKEEEEDMFQGLTVKDSPQSKNEKKEEKEEKKNDSKQDILDSFFGPESNTSYVAPKPSQKNNSPNVVLNYPTQQPQIIYVVQNSVGQRQMQRNPMQIQPQRTVQSQQNFDFLNQQNNDSHFDFVREEIAQRTKK